MIEKNHNLCWNNEEYFSAQRFPDVKSIVGKFSGVIGKSLAVSFTAEVVACNILLNGAGESGFFSLVGSRVVLKMNANLNCYWLKFLTNILSYLSI